MNRIIRLTDLELEQRITPTGGNPDPTFQTTGTVILTDRAPGQFNDVLVDAANRTVAVGRSNDDMLIARFRPDGTPDPRFGTNGFVSFDFAGDVDGARGVVVRNDGSLWVSGTVTGTDKLARIALLDVSANGVVRQTFTRDIGNDGLSDVAGKLAVNSATGDIYIAAQATRNVTGGTDTDNAVVRFSSKGVFQGEWRSTGVSGGKAAAVTVDPADARVFVAGRGATTFLIARLDADLGNPVQKTVAPPPNEFTGAFSVFINPNNQQLYFVGTSAMGNTIVRTDNTLKVLATNFLPVGTNDGIFDATLDTQGRIVIAAITNNINSVSGPFNLMLARTSASIAYDTTFGNNGKRLYDLGGNDQSNGGVALAPDGRIVIAGFTGKNNVNTPVVARYLANDTVPPPPPPNTPPVVTPPGGVTVVLGTNPVGPIGPLTCGLTDDATPTNYVQITATSNNTVLFPPGSIVVNNSGTSPTLTLTPAPGQSGTATITLTAVDQDGATTNQTFSVSVVPNTSPTVTTIANQSLAAGQDLAAVPFTVGDTETPANQLVVTATSSNPTLIANTGIVIGGAGPNRTISVTPISGQSGVATVTVTVTDTNGGTTTVVFTVTVRPNEPPTVTVIANQSITVGQSLGPIDFTVGDAETPVSQLVVTATSSNPTLVPATGVALGGAGTDRTVTITPAPGQTGSAVITVSVVDAGGQTATQSFTFTVNSATINTPPTLSSIANQSITAGQNLGPIAITVGDAETPATQLVVTATVSNSTLIANSGIVVSGSGPNQTLTITPIPGQTGVATVTVTVSDTNSGTTTQSFTVTVSPAAVNTPPSVSAIANQNVPVGQALSAIPFTVGDAQTPASQLVVTATSSNPTLIASTGIVISGSGPDQTISVTPVPGQTGVATVTVAVADAGGLTATQSFTVTVNPATISTPPTLSSIANQSITVVQSLGRIAFTIGDAETPANQLVVTANSSNLTLVPATGIVLGGSGSNRTIAVTPISGQTGTAVITVTVVDASGQTATQSFTLSVTPVSEQFRPQLVGWREFAVGADVGESTVAFFNPDGTTRFTRTPFAGFTGGVRTAAGDFNGDGVADLIVGTGPGRSTQVLVLDGKTQAELFSVDPFEASFTGGVYVAVGDVNGDDTPDLAITPDEGGGPRVDVYSGRQFVKLTSFFGIDDPNFRGGARSAIADMTGDGTADLIVVAGFGGGPRVAGFDGKSLGSTPQKIFGDFFAFEQTLRNGIFVTAGDINGDGFADLICGGGPGGGPRVLAFDGKNLIQNQYTNLANFFGGEVNSRGGIRLAVKDLDGDNRADLVVGSGGGAGSRVTSYLGTSIAANGTPPKGLDFDVFQEFVGGIFVG